MSGETHLWLIRHAPVSGPRDVIHAENAPADTSGTAAIALLRSQLPLTRSVFCSPAQRARDTAQALGLAPAEAPAFREQDFGAWTGRRHDDIRKEPGSAYAEFWRSPARNRPPGGESFVDQIARVADGLAALPAGDVILIVHSGTIRAALAIALNLEPESALRFAIEPLSLTRIDRLENGWRVGAVNHCPWKASGS